MISKASKYFGKFWRFLNGSAFVLLLLGFALTTVVGGILTNKWQAREKSWEIKTTLVSQMTEEIINILMAIQFVEVGATSQTQADFDAAYKRWEVRRMVIESTISAYFPDQDLASGWSALAKAVTIFYALTGTSDTELRAKQITDLKSYLGEAAADWTVLEGLEWRKSQDRQGYLNYSRSWFDVRSALVRRNEALQRLLLAGELLTGDSERFKLAR